MKRWIAGALWAVTVGAGCALTQSAQRTATEGSAPRAESAAPVVRRLLQQEWEAQRGRFEEVTLETVSPRVEVSMMGDAGPPPGPGVLRLTECQPGGSSEAVLRERATGALWRLRTVGGLSVPAGVVISATRCFREDLRLPAGAAIQGTLEVSYPSFFGEGAVDPRGMTPLPGGP